MEIVFVRHAQPAWSRDGLTVDNPGLTDLGHQQAEALGVHLAGEPIDELLVSPLVRARQTAEPIARSLGLAPTTVDYLAEITNPAWEGTPTEEVERTFREVRGWSVDQLWDGLPGGESFRDFHRRVTTGIASLLEERGAVRTNEFPPQWKHPDERRILIVAHAGTNATAIGWLLGIEPVPWEWERFITFHASISIARPIEIGGASAYSLACLSDVDHLVPDQRTR